MRVKTDTSVKNDSKLNDSRSKAKSPSNIRSYSKDKDSFRNLLDKKTSIIKKAKNSIVIKSVVPTKKTEPEVFHQLISN
jgi:hypothetical protein